MEEVLEAKMVPAVADLVQLLEDRLLGLQVLVDGLDDHIHIGRHMDADRGGQAAHAGLLLSSGHAALLHQALQALADAGLPPLKGGLALVVQNDLIASLDGQSARYRCPSDQNRRQKFCGFPF